MLDTGELDGGRICVNHIRLRPQEGGRLGLPAPPQSELLLPPPHVRVENGVEEEVGSPALSEHPHHQELEFIEGQSSVLKF